MPDPPNSSSARRTRHGRTASANSEPGAREPGGGSAGNYRAATQDRLGQALSDLLENPLVTGAIGRAWGAREKAAQAQELWMGALNIPSAADIERLTRRLRSVSQRLEGVEDGVQRLGRSIVQSSGLDARLDGIEERLHGISAELHELRELVGGLSSNAPSAPSTARTRTGSSSRARPATASARPKR